MPVVNTKSARVTNADALVPVMDRVVVNHGRKRSLAATIETTATDSIGSTYRMARVHSSWRITSIKVFCDAITLGAADIGLYRTAADGGAVVAAQAYASAQSIATASVTGIECAYEQRDIANIERQVWQDAGATADPSIWYDLTATLTAAPSAGGTLSFEIEYVAND